MKAEDFVIKFIPVLKVEFQLIPTYVYHVAMLVCNFKIIFVVKSHAV